MPEQDSYPCRRRGIASRLVEGEAVIIDPIRNLVYVLNATASAAWHLADGTRRDSAIVDGVAQRFHETREKVAADLAGLWTALTDRGLLDLPESPAESPAGRNPADERNLGTGQYAEPRIESEEALNVLAAVCSSARDGSGFSCQSFGSCQIPFQ